MRRGHLQARLGALDEAQLHAAIDEGMGRFGSALSVLSTLLSNTDTHHLFLRVTFTPTCSNCHELARPHLVQPSNDEWRPLILLTTQELYAAGGNVLAALDRSCSTVRSTRSNMRCAQCAGTLELVPHTSWPTTHVGAGLAAAGGAASNSDSGVPAHSDSGTFPRLIALELPERAPATLQHSLPQQHCFGTGSAAAASFRLIAVLYYLDQCHFIAYVLDPRELIWLRYDGMHANGCGTPVAAPHGRIQHNGAEYFPVAAIYVRREEGDRGTAGSGATAAGASPPPPRLLRQRRQANVWSRNSCYVDSALVVWEHIERWLAVAM